MAIGQRLARSPVLVNWTLNEASAVHAAVPIPCVRPTATPPSPILRPSLRLVSYAYSGSISTQQLSQTSETTKQCHGNGAARPSEQFRNLRLRQIFSIAEHQDLNSSR